MVACSESKKMEDGSLLVSSPDRVHQAPPPWNHRGLALRIFALHLGEESAALQAVENAGIDVVIDVPAFQRYELVSGLRHCTWL